MINVAGSGSDTRRLSMSSHHPRGVTRLTRLDWLAGQGCYVGGHQWSCVVLIECYEDGNSTSPVRRVVLSSAVMIQLTDADEVQLMCVHRRSFQRSAGLYSCICSRGVATGVDIGIYTPQKSAKVNFLWGKNDVRTAIQQFYPPPKTFIPPQNKFLATPLICLLSSRVYLYIILPCKHCINVSFLCGLVVSG